MGLIISDGFFLFSNFPFTRVTIFPPRRVVFLYSLGKPPFRFRHNPFHGLVFRLIFAVEKAKVGFTSA